MGRSESTRNGRPRRLATIVSAAMVVLGALALAFWFTRGGSAPQGTIRLVTVTRGDVTATVGGVGRISVPTTATEVVAGGGSATGAGGGASAGGAGASVLPDAVFARASGHVGRLFVAPNQRVSAGQMLAAIDDGGVAAAALAQAEGDYASALVEAQADAGAAASDASRAAADLEALRGGAPAARTRALLIARRNVRLARDRLRIAISQPTPADAGAARADVARAQADLASLRSAPRPSPEALAAAQQAVALAEQRLAGLRAGPSPASLSAAEADVRTAESELAAVQSRTPPAGQGEIDAAMQSLATARAALAKLTAPVDPVDLSSAQLDLDKARADLVALTAPAAASPEALAAAQQTVDAAQLKLRGVLAGSVTADRTSARLELQRAESELRGLESGPSSKALEAANSSIEASAARLALVRSRPKVKAALTLLAASRAAAGALEVRAPAAGTVTSVFTAPGSPVDPSTPIAAVSDLDHLVASVDLSEFDVARVRRGLRAIVSVDALGGRRTPGRVRFVALTGNDSGGVVSFPVQVTIVRSNGLRAGLNVSVRIILAQRKGVVRIPVEAVSTGANDQSVVTVVDESDRRSMREVTLGLEDTKNVEVLRGLRAGERVALPAAEGGGP